MHGTSIKLIKSVQLMPKIRFHVLEKYVEKCFDQIS